MPTTDLITKQCLAARNHCVLFDHPNRGVIEVSGRDCIQFLHNILSNDVKSLEPGRGIPACLLTAQAKIIAHMNVLCFDEYVWLAMDHILKDRVMEELSKLIFTEEIALTDLSDPTSLLPFPRQESWRGKGKGGGNHLELISIHGPRAKDLMVAVLDEADPSITLPTNLLDHSRTMIKSVPVTIIRINLIGEIGYAFLIAKPYLPPPLHPAKNRGGGRERVGGESWVRKLIEEKGRGFGLMPIEPEALEILRIEAGIPRYGIDFDESHIPLEVRLDQTVSFTKGCFPGQEILARLDSRGGVSNKLVGLVIESDTIPQKNDRILNEGKVVGRVTSATFSPTLENVGAIHELPLRKMIALGYVKKGFWEPGCDLEIETQDKTTGARVESLPFAGHKF